jgi:hypothetical protein
LAGGIHVIVAVRPLIVTVGAAGAAGAVAGDPATGNEGWPKPAALAAATSTQYVVPLVNPARTHDVPVTFT